MTGEECAV